LASIIASGVPTEPLQAIAPARAIALLGCLFWTLTLLALLVRPDPAIGLVIWLLFGGSLLAVGLNRLLRPAAVGIGWRGQQIVLRQRSGQVEWGQPAAVHFVSPFFLSFVLSGARGQRSRVVLFPDQLPPDAWRRLSAMLKRLQQAAS